jgi:glycosyltransferase involved in cell wall biosynthesis
MPDCSIIIPAYNSQNTIVRSVESALPQGKVIVVDDGSTDSTVEVIKTHFQKDLNENLILVELNVNLGVSYARNQGLEFVDTEWVQYLDSDDFLLPDKIFRQIELTNSPISWVPVVVIEQDGRMKPDRRSDLSLLKTSASVPQTSAFLFKREVGEKIKWNTDYPAYNTPKYIWDCLQSGFDARYVESSVWAVWAKRKGSISSDWKLNSFYKTQLLEEINIL